jgi:ABC-type enterobactin transport system permease subunit
MRRRRLGVVVVLLAVLLVCMVVAAAVGTVYVQFGDVITMCWNKLSPFNFAQDGRRSLPGPAAQPHG